MPIHTSKALHLVGCLKLTDMKKALFYTFLLLFLGKLGIPQDGILDLKGTLQATLDSIVEEQELPGATAAIV